MVLYWLMGVQESRNALHMTFGTLAWLSSKDIKHTCKRVNGAGMRLV